MNFCALIITDGRKEMLQAMHDSFFFCAGDVEIETRIVDDSGDDDYTDWLEDTYGFGNVFAHDYRAGLAQAIRTGWDLIPDNTDYVIHLEDDCVFTHPIDLDAWTAPLRADPDIAQVVLQRGPNNEDEHAHGGILKAWSAAGVSLTQEDGYVTHQHLFSLQPNIYRASLCAEGWPEHGGEREFTDQLLAKNPNTKFAYLGTPDSEPVYEHVGYGQRSAGWVL